MAGVDPPHEPHHSGRAKGSARRDERLAARGWAVDAVASGGVAVELDD